MLSRIQFLAVHFQKRIPKMKTILFGVILAGQFAVSGCSQTSEKPGATGPNGGEMGNQRMKPGHMHGDTNKNTK